MLASILASLLSLYSIPVVWLTGYWPAFTKVTLVASTIGYNNLAPRENVQTLKEKNPELGARAARMEAAHQNGFEIMPLWIGAVLAGNLAGLETIVLNKYAIAFVGLRIAYNYIYINQSTQLQAALRSVTWMTGLLMPMTIVIKAANKISEST
ncbi:hypothetical protein JAAARDRAFT_710448 [Jaapia argillacea MUCL 33604]|uniref:Uncharacterized protein n=1 Tax=Jaapia argillacea MUCL 33604 TaxID=933084 RepID=A0A067PJC2_9AGAM|nr:hypothetical protein JAAARDRAFT_710448 [Jaapia argillacea MUCL 33604]